MIVLLLVCILLALMGGANLVILFLRLAFTLIMTLVGCSIAAVVWGLWCLHHNGIL